MLILERRGMRFAAVLLAFEGWLEGCLVGGLMVMEMEERRGEESRWVG